jgi:hypothetical protein
MKAAVHRGDEDAEVLLSSPCYEKKLIENLVYETELFEVPQDSVLIAVEGGPRHASGLGGHRRQR